MSGGFVTNTRMTDTKPSLESLESLDSSDLLSATRELVRKSNGGAPVAAAAGPDVDPQAAGESSGQIASDANVSRVLGQRRPTAASGRTKTRVALTRSEHRANCARAGPAPTAHCAAQWRNIQVSVHGHSRASRPAAGSAGSPPPSRA